jgi:hypothetical protein
MATCSQLPDVGQEWRGTRNLNGVWVTDEYGGSEVVYNYVIFSRYSVKRYNEVVSEVGGIPAVLWYARSTGSGVGNSQERSIQEKAHSDGTEVNLIMSDAPNQRSPGRYVGRFRHTGRTRINTPPAGEEKWRPVTSYELERVK